MYALSGYSRLVPNPNLSSVYKGRGIIAYDNSKAVGFVLWSELYEGSWVEGEAVAVDPQYRNTGLAPRLWRRFMKEARKMGAKKIVARVHEKNSPVHGYLKRLSAVPYTEIDGFTFYTMEIGDNRNGKRRQ